jgi:curli biogenesis system outer membrane secretion channel CsgG
MRAALRDWGVACAQLFTLHEPAETGRATSCSIWGNTDHMRTLMLCASALALFASAPAFAQTNTSSQGRTYKDGTTKGASSGRRDQERSMANIPVCTRKLGTVAIVEPENKWWRELNLGSPEAILKLFVQRSGCFTIVNRGRSLQSRAIERAMAEDGELQAGSNLGRGQVKAADYYLEPDIVSSNRNSGGGGLGAVAGGLLGRSFLGAVAGGLNIKKKEASVTLSIVNARTTEEEAMTEGYARKTDIGFGGGAGGGWWDGFGAAGASGYQNTEIGQVIVLAYLDAYTKMVQELGGLPANASAAAPRAR